VDVVAHHHAAARHVVLLGVDEVVTSIAMVASKPMRRSLPGFSSPIQKGAHTGRVGHISVTGRVTHGRVVDQAAG
jgi:hypothetical protein